MPISKKTFLSVSLIALAFAPACKKDPEPTNTTPEPPPIYANYSKLATGNYWIYQRFELDTAGNETPMNVYDSCYVEKDSLIHGKTYYKYVSPSFAFPETKEVLFLRDSSHYTVTHTGIRLLSSENFSDNIHSFYWIPNGGPDTMYHVTRKMADKNQMVSTPYGTLGCINAQNRFHYLYPGPSYGQVYYGNNRYSQNIGLVTETINQVAGAPTYQERRLVRYHVH